MWEDGVGVPGRGSCGKRFGNGESLGARGGGWHRRPGRHGSFHGGWSSSSAGSSLFSGGRDGRHLGQDGEGSGCGVGPRLVLEGPRVDGRSCACFRDVGGLLHGRGEEPRAELVEE